MKYIINCTHDAVENVQLIHYPYDSYFEIYYIVNMPEVASDIGADCNK